MYFTPKTNIQPCVYVRFGPKADICAAAKRALFDHLASSREQVVGTVSPSAFAVLRLIVSSNLVGACTGSSAGFAPLECGPHSPPSAGRYRQNLAHRTSAHHQQRTAARAQCEAAGAAPVPRGS